MEKLFSLGNTPEFIALLDNTVRALHSAGNAADVRFFFILKNFLRDNVDRSREMSHTHTFKYSSKKRP
jgi:hypothetical protein